MKSLIELKMMETEGKKLTKEEQAYLDRWKNLKRVKHSSSFVSHARSIPEEPPHGRTNTD